MTHMRTRRYHSPGSRVERTQNGTERIRGHARLGSQRAGTGKYKVNSQEDGKNEKWSRGQMNSVTGRKQAGQAYRLIGTG